MIAPSPITSLLIRPASPDDAKALARLAALDSSPVPGGPVLVAAIDGELAAAVAIETGEHVADPFRPTADAVDALRLHARRVRVSSPRPPARRLRSTRTA